MRNTLSMLVSMSISLAVATVALSGCGDTCGSDDVDCFLEHLVILNDEPDSKPIELVRVDASRLTPSGGAEPVKCLGQICGSQCVNPTFDPNNCGSCGVACAPGQTCTGGTCTCASGYSSCGASCVDLMNDALNCGSCGNSCAGGYCQYGTCVSSCALTTCDGSCVDTMTDSANCGACGNACPANLQCQGGSCKCVAPPYACGCIDPANDPANCGGCGNACAPGETCTGGLCCAAGDPACGGGGGGGGGEPVAGPPSFDAQPEPMTITDPSEMQPLELTFTDPCGYRPASCFQVCSSTGRCSSGFMCAPPVKDGLTTGVWRSYLGVLVEPASTVTLTTDVTPVNGKNCEDNVLDLLNQGNENVLVGATVSIELTLESDSTYDDTSGSGSGSGGYESQCSDDAQTCDCYVRACADSNGACWYETSNGSVDCNGCDCQAAANAIVSSCCPH